MNGASYKLLLQFNCVGHQGSGDYCPFRSTLSIYGCSPRKWVLVGAENITGPLLTLPNSSLMNCPKKMFEFVQPLAGSPTKLLLRLLDDVISFLHFKPKLKYLNSWISDY